MGRRYDGSNPLLGFVHYGGYRGYVKVGVKGDSCSNKNLVRTQVLSTEVDYR